MSINMAVLIIADGSQVGFKGVGWLCAIQIYARKRSGYSKILSKNCVEKCRILIVLFGKDVSVFC